MAARSVCLLTMAAVLLLLGIPLQLPAPATAASSTVLQPVVCTMGNQGTPASITFSVSTGTVSPSTVTCDGASVNLNVTAGATLTATEPTDTPPTRYRFTGVLQSSALTVCSSGPCTTWSLTNYYQWELEVYYSLVGGGSPTAPVFTCQSGGSPSSAFLSTSPTPTWTDNGCAWLINPNPLTGSGSNERWEAQVQPSGTVTGALTIDPVFFHQYDLSMSYSVIGGGSPVAPSLTSAQFGSFFSYPLTTSPQDYWLDSGASWSISSSTPDSTSTERWATPAVSSGTVTSSLTLSFSFYHQYSLQFSYSVSGGGSGYSAPSLTYTSLGVRTQAGLSTAATPYWLDAGSSWSASGQLSGSSASERWSTKVSTGSVGSPSSVVLAYYHQYLLSASYTVSGGGSGYTSPALTYQSYGSQSSGAFAQGPFWADSGGSWSADNPLSGSSSLERWETSATTSGTVSSSLTLALSYFHQYFITFDFGIVGGGTGYSPPAVDTFQFGAQVSELSGWADAGSTYSFTNPLNGSSSAQRWYTGSGQGVVTSPSLVNATYHHQYDFVLSYKVVGAAVQLPPPTLNSTALGLPFSVALQTTPTDNWLDSSSSWAVSPALQGSSGTERWMTDQATSGRASTSLSLVLSYFDQYAAGFDYAVQGGGSPAPPSLNYTSFSAPVAATLNSTRVVYWLDSGSAWSLTNPIAGPSGVERWISTKGTSGTAQRPFNETAVYAHQYYLAVKPNVQAGGTIQLSSDWHDSGSGVLLNVTASSGWRFFGWTGEGVGSYTGSNPAEEVSMGSAINETAVFYAGLALTSGAGGSVQYRYGQLNGSVPAGGNETLYVAPGTVVNLTSTPATVAYTFAGWSGKLAGTAQNATLTVTAPTRVSASFGLDYTDIGAFYIVTIVVTVLAVYVFVVRRRHAVFRSGQLKSQVD